jgi:signal transduction histidine kinase
MRSLTHRLVIVVLLSELLLTVTVTAINLSYERSQRYKAFDVMLRGRAESVLGAVEVDEDKEIPFLNFKAIDLPQSDRFEVHIDSGERLGHSTNWVDLPSTVGQTPWQVGRLRIDKVNYRYITIQGLRKLDPDVGLPHTVGVVIFYASPTTSVRNALLRAGEFLVGANFLVLALSGLLAASLVRRGMQPLQELAVAASSITTKSWNFNPPKSARSLHELSSLILALETSLQGLERSFQQQQHFIHDAAHELKTAVTIIKSSLQLLIYQPRTADEYRRGVEASLIDCGRMEDLVQKMLTLAHAEQLATAGHTGAQVSAKAGEVILRVIEHLRSVAELHSVHVQTNIASDLVTPVSADHWDTLATNLILNAIQHSKPGGTITVACQANHNSILFTVTDRGMGIPGDSIPRVFDRFYRGDPSRARTTGGTGLGLAICKAVAEYYRGKITVKSVPDQETTVSVSFPLQIESSLEHA